MRAETDQTRDLLLENVAVAILLPVGSAGLFLLLSRLLSIEIPKNLYSTAVLFIWLGSLLGLLLPFGRLLLARGGRQRASSETNAESFLPAQLTSILLKLFLLPCLALALLYLADLFFAVVTLRQNWKHAFFVVWALTLLVGVVDFFRSKRRRTERSRQRYKISSVS